MEEDYRSQIPVLKEAGFTTLSKIYNITIYENSKRLLAANYLHIFSLFLKDFGINLVKLSLRNGVLFVLAWVAWVACLRG